MPGGVNVVHSDNRLQLMVTGNPHSDEDSYVRKRRCRSVAPGKDYCMLVRLTAQTVLDVAMFPPRAGSRRSQATCWPMSSSRAFRQTKRQSAGSSQ
jgi:hypothetical protein